MKWISLQKVVQFHLKHPIANPTPSANEKRISNERKHLQLIKKLANEAQMETCLM